MKKILSFLWLFLFFASSSVWTYAVEANFWAQRKAQHKVKQRAWAPPVRLPVLSKNQPFPSFKKTPFPKLQKIPLSRGMIRETHLNTAQRNPPVFIIQDVHQNREAQRNIAFLLSALADDNTMIGVEGGTGPFQFRRFRSFEDKNITRQIAQEFLDTDQISAPSYLGLTADEPLPKIIGVDDPAHHAAHVKAYRDSQKVKAEVRAELETYKTVLDQQKEQVFNPLLRELDTLQQAHRSGDLNFARYISQLIKRVPVTPGHHMDIFLNAFELEQTLDFNQVDQERRVLLDRLLHKLKEPDRQALKDLSLHLQTGELSPGHFYSSLIDRLKQHNIALHSFGEFQRYVQYVLLSDQVQTTSLMEEFDAFEKAAFAAAVQSNEEKKMVQKSNEIFLTSKLLDFSLTPHDWQTYQQASIHHPKLDPFQEFYKQADRRSEKMVENLLSRPTSNSDFILVTGGFHTPLITELLKKRGRSYVLLQPKLTHVQTIEGTKYLSVFSQEKTPLARLFEGDVLYLASAAPLLGLTGSEEASLRFLFRQIHQNHPTMGSGVALTHKTPTSTKGHLTRPRAQFQLTQSHHQPKGSTPVDANLWIHLFPEDNQTQPIPLGLAGWAQQTVVPFLRVLRLPDRVVAIVTGFIEEFEYTGFFIFLPSLLLGTSLWPLGLILMFMGAFLSFVVFDDDHKELQYLIKGKIQSRPLDRTPQPDLVSEEPNTFEAGVSDPLPGPFDFSSVCREAESQARARLELKTSFSVEDISAFLVHVFMLGLPKEEKNFTDPRRFLQAHEKELLEKIAQLTGDSSASLVFERAFQDDAYLTALTTLYREAEYHREERKTNHVRLVSPVPLSPGEIRQRIRSHQTHVLLIDHFDGLYHGMSDLYARAKLAQILKDRFPGPSDFITHNNAIAALSQNPTYPLSIAPIFARPEWLDPFGRLTRLAYWDTTHRKKDGAVEVPLSHPITPSQAQIWYFEQNEIDKHKILSRLFHQNKIPLINSYTPAQDPSVPAAAEIADSKWQTYQVFSEVSSEFLTGKNYTFDGVVFRGPVHTPKTILIEQGEPLGTIEDRVLELTESQTPFGNPKLILIRGKPDSGTLGYDQFLTHLDPSNFDPDFIGLLHQTARAAVKQPLVLQHNVGNARHGLEVKSKVSVRLQVTRSRDGQYKTAGGLVVIGGIDSPTSNTDNLVGKGYSSRIHDLDQNLWFVDSRGNRHKAFLSPDRFTQMDKAAIEAVAALNHGRPEPQKISMAGVDLELEFHPVGGLDKIWILEVNARPASLNNSFGINPTDPAPFYEDIWYLHQDTWKDRRITDERHSLRILRLGLILTYGLVWILLSLWFQDKRLISLMALLAAGGGHGVVYNGLLAPLYQWALGLVSPPPASSLSLELNSYQLEGASHPPQRQDDQNQPQTPASLLDTIYWDRRSAARIVNSAA